MESRSRSLRIGLAFLGRVWSLAAPYWRSDERRLAWGLLVAIVGLTLGMVYLNVVFNDWYRTFYNALEQRDVDTFWRQMLIFCGLAVVYIVGAIYRLYLTQMLEMRWRAWLTDRYVSSWLSNQLYYRLELQNAGTDNPDQRIAEDLRNFTINTLSLSLGLLGSVVTLGSFVVILWGVSGPLTFTLGEMEITIPGYMVWGAILYAIVGSILTHYIGRHLIGINFRQERFEADFRFSLVRLRENAEGVALYRGERSEQGHLRRRFDAIQANWGELMRYTKRLTGFTAGYNQAAIIFPFLLGAPRYFAGEIPLGGLLQISNAFRQVEDSLSWFINAYARLADWKASVDRLITFHDALDRLTSEAAHSEGRNGAVAATQPGGIKVRSHAEPVLRAEGLSLALPNGRSIVEDATFAVERGDRVLVSGPSGCGKSTLFRAVAGIWPFGQGTVTLPEDANVLFLPQKPYIPIGTLRDAVAYPATGSTFDDDAIREALAAVKLAGLAERLDEAQNWSMQLSGGEQQRLAVARALLHHPDWLFLDEATSALDAANEEHIAGLLRERLADSTIVSIAHHPTGDAPQDLTIELRPTDAGTTLQTTRRKCALPDGTAEPLVLPAAAPTQPQTSSVSATS
jgi:vitamin B12/bleomycin/antimicrobial peptide transport system ATP-binding/permease protein